jgi:hypothetical protein
MDASVLSHRDRVSPASPLFPALAYSLHRISLSFYLGSNFFLDVVDKYAGEFAPFYDKINSRIIKTDDDVHKDERNIRNDNEKDEIMKSIIEDNNLYDNDNFLIRNDDLPNLENLATSDQPNINVI